MTYTHITLLALVLSIFNDRLVFKTHLTSKKVFWTSYSIILPFQLLTNWWLTSRNIVMYNPESIIGIRVASAPVEDLFFGFASTLSRRFRIPNLMMSAYFSHETEPEYLYRLIGNQIPFGCHAHELHAPLHWQNILNKKE